MSARILCCLALPLLASTAQPKDRAARAVSVSAAQPMTTSFLDGFERLDEKRWFVSNGWVNGPIQGCTWSRQAVSVSKGVLRLRVAKAQNQHRPYICGEVQTRMRLGYGWYEARVRTVSGSGFNSAIFTYSGPPNTKVHDEIDFEFLGKNARTVQLNYFVNGRGEHGSVQELGLDASHGFNRYAFQWSPGTIRWFVNDHLVRTSNDKSMPETPGLLFASVWSGTAQVDDWLGRFDPSSLPVLMEVDWIAYTRAGERCRFPESTSCRH